MSARYMEMPKERHQVEDEENEEQEEEKKKEEMKVAKRAAKVGVGLQVVVAVVSWQSGEASCSRN